MFGSCPNARCYHEKKIIRKELISWQKKLPLLMGLETVLHGLRSKCGTRVVAPLPYEIFDDSWRRPDGDEKTELTEDELMSDPFSGKKCVLCTGQRAESISRKSSAAVDLSMLALMTGGCDEPLDLSKTSSILRNCTESLKVPAVSRNQAAPKSAASKLSNGLSNGLASSRTVGGARPRPSTGRKGSGASATANLNSALSANSLGISIPALVSQATNGYPGLELDKLPNVDFGELLKEQLMQQLTQTMCAERLGQLVGAMTSPPTTKDTDKKSDSDAAMSEMDTESYKQWRIASWVLEAANQQQLDLAKYDDVINESVTASALDQNSDVGKVLKTAMDSALQNQLGSGGGVAGVQTQLGSAGNTPGDGSTISPSKRSHSDPNKSPPDSKRVKQEKSATAGANPFNSIDPLAALTSASFGSKNGMEQLAAYNLALLQWQAVMLQQQQNPFYSNFLSGWGAGGAGSSSGSQTELMKQLYQQLGLKYEPSSTGAVTAGVQQNGSKK